MQTIFFSTFSAEQITRGGVKEEKKRSDLFCRIEIGGRGRIGVRDCSQTTPVSSAAPAVCEVSVEGFFLEGGTDLEINGTTVVRVCLLKACFPLIDKFPQLTEVLKSNLAALTLIEHLYQQAAIV